MTHSENYVRFLKTHPPPNHFFFNNAMAMWKGGFISNLRIRQIFFFIFCKNGWQEKLLLRFSDLYQLVFSGNPFFSDSFDYVSILLTPPTHHVSKRKHLTSPTHYFAYVIFEWSLSICNLMQFLVFTWTNWPQIGHFRCLET